MKAQIEDSAAPAPSSPVVAPGTGFSPAYRGYALFLLLIVYISNYADRQIINVLAKPIKDEFGITNTAWGFLTGVSFAIFYATLGIPIAMLADRRSRKWILSIATVIWSVMTALCGQATSYTMLLLARIGVGVGEAGGSPPSHSMISDLYPPHLRATALAVFSLGVPLGNFVGSLAGNAVAVEYGWRSAFLVLGIPGLLLALLVALTLKEPPRGASEVHIGTKDAPTLRAVATFMGSQRSLVHVIIGATLMTMAGYGGLSFLALFLQQSHGVTQAQVGPFMAAYTGVVAAIGTFAGGYFADVLSKRDIAWSTRVVTAAVLAAAIPGTLAYVLDDSNWVLWLLIAPNLVGGLYLAPTFALTQNLVGLRMRATAAAILLFIINLIGLGLGPLIVGVLADLLEPATGKHNVRWALLMASSLSLWAAYHYYIAPKTLRADLERAKKA